LVLAVLGVLPQAELTELTAYLAQLLLLGAVLGVVRGQLEVMEEVVVAEHTEQPLAVQVQLIKVTTVAVV
jgi:hypothetical protein|tara:strand:+ start:1091 stop:1300 length:210 start_codon:yes stop_codon:yes gene_type:complete